MDKTSSPDAPVETQSRFWVGPLVAGCCFALGYGITERVLTLQTNAEDPVPEAFTPLAFPGDSLQEIRSRFSDDDAELQVDVTALEAAEAASRPAKPVVKEAIKPDLALQTPEPPVWTAPAWSDSQTIDPSLTTATPIPWWFRRSPSRSCLLWLSLMVIHRSWLLSRNLLCCLLELKPFLKSSSP